MYYFAYGFKKPIAPLLCLQIAQQNLANAGFTVFDPVQPGKVTLGATHTDAGVMVTVVVNSFCASDLAVDSAKMVAESVYNGIEYA